MDSKNITLKVNSELYNKYKDYCKQKGLILSRQFEILMEDQLKDFQNSNNKTFKQSAGAN